LFGNSAHLFSFPYPAKRILRKIFLLMNRGLLILNVILALAVAVLFYLYFSPKKAEKTTAKPVAAGVTGTTRSADFSIAYFELDSVNNSFSMVQDIKADLSREEDKMMGEMRGLQKRYEDKVRQYQQQAQSQQMSEAQSEMANRDVLQMQEAIRNKKAEMDQAYQNLYMQKQQSIRKKIEEFLKEYNQRKNFSYIFANEGGFMFFKDSAFDITQDVIKGLNERYKSDKKKK
jgi:outer membrane protein